MDSNRLLDCYVEIQTLTLRMQEFARTEQWDALIDLEQIRASITDDLMNSDKEALWDGLALKRKGELIRSILEMDSEIKRLTQGWRGELQEILGSIDNKKKLNKAYDAP